MSDYILSIDEGTSGAKVLLFDEQGQLVRRVNRHHQQFYPHPGWVEHDAEEIYQNVVSAMDQLVTEAGVSPDDIRALSLTNQRETVVLWDKRTGKPVYNAVVWQCNRAAALCDQRMEAGYAETVFQKSGLVLSPYYSAAKLTWLLDHVDGARAAAERGELLAGTIDSWLIYKLTGGRVHATDYSNASRTQLMNLRSLCWDEQLLHIFDIPAAILPAIVPSDHLFGEVAVGILGGRGVPIAGVMGDSHAALFGQNGMKRGMAKVTYGTGSSIMMNIGTVPYDSKKGLVTSVGWGVNGEVIYVAEGNINCSAATIKWLVEDMQLLHSSAESEEIAASVSSSDGVYLVPAFVGLGTPYWSSDATALITGMTRGTKKAHIVRAALEAIGYQVRDVIDIMAVESGTTVSEIRVDGGASRNRLLMQFQADILPATVVVNRVEEICATGCAYMGGLATGLWKLSDLSSLRRGDTHFSPQMDAGTRAALYDGWKKAVARTLAKF